MIAGAGGVYLSKVNRIRSVGAGTDYLYHVRDLSLFDPEEEGNLSGTGFITGRTKNGPYYQIPLTTDLSGI